MQNNEPDKGKLVQQYDKLASKFKELYLEEKVRGREAMAEALEKARAQLTAVGEFSEEHGEELKRYLLRDLDQTIVDAQRLGEEAKEVLHPARLGAGTLHSIATVLDVTSNALHVLSDKARQTLSYTTGELTSAGTLTCQECGQKVHFKQTGHVPPCPHCSSTRFSKSY